MSCAGLGGAVGLCRLFLEQVVVPGDQVVDATCGRGRDTLFLARLVGAAGRVWAFDVQEEALAATRTLLEEAGCLSHVVLVPAGHETMSEHVAGTVRAVVFNLGYLPGSKSAAVTQPASTLAALQQSVELLVPGGIVAIAVYTGHAGGPEESRAVSGWAAGLPSRRYNVWESRHLNRSSSAPHVIIVEKLP